MSTVKCKQGACDKGRTIRKVKGGVGQNQKKNLSPAKNEKKKNLSRHSAKKKIAFLEDTELPSLTVYPKRKKGRTIRSSNKGSRANFWIFLANHCSGKFFLTAIVLYWRRGGGGGGRQ